MKQKEGSKQVWMATYYCDLVIVDTEVEPCFGMLAICGGKESL